jgi:hypothetical protein
MLIFSSPRPHVAMEFCLSRNRRQWMKLGANEKAGPITDFLLGDHGDWELANRTF